MQKWEYKVFRGSLEELNDFTLNELGDDGWELVIASQVGWSRVIIFKRPKF